MIVAELLSPNDSMHVGFHEFLRAEGKEEGRDQHASLLRVRGSICSLRASSSTRRSSTIEYKCRKLTHLNEINLVEGLVGLWTNDVEDGDDVLVSAARSSPKRYQSQLSRVQNGRLTSHRLACTIKTGWRVVKRGDDQPEVSEQLDLPERPEAKHRVLEGRYTLNGDFGSGRYMNGRDSVGSKRRKKKSVSG